MAAAVLLAVVATGGVGLFGIYSEHRSAARAAEDGDRLRAVELALKRLEIEFKVEVQEWKNLLLRGQTPEGFAEWRKTYEQQVLRTTGAFGELKQLPAITAEEVADIEATAAQHAVNAVFYRDALMMYRQGNPSTIFAVDDRVRGRDRAITAALDEQAGRIRRRHMDLVRAAQDDADARYARYRMIAGGVSIIAIALALGLAMQAAALARHSQTN